MQLKKIKIRKNISVKTWTRQTALLSGKSEQTVDIL